MRRMRMRMRVAVAVVMAVAVGALGLFVAQPARSAEFAAECEYAPNGPSALAVGAVGCLRIPNDTLGAPAPFSYYIPPACAPSTGAHCPVLYYLHGTGGSYQQFGAMGSHGNSLVQALTAGPPVDPRTTADPWDYADPSTWVAKPSIDMILIAPHGMTLPGGYGPISTANSFWMDWNPRYAKGGDDPKYDTPAPRFETFLSSELVPYVDNHFPAIADRTGRAIDGKSMGGIGALANGFKHPDIWASSGALSGGGFPSTGVGSVEATDDAIGPVGVAPPAPVPYVHPPGIASQAPGSVVWDPTLLYGPVATVGFGDLATENVYFRGNTAEELVRNNRAYNNGQQVPHIRYHINDAIPHRGLVDLQDPGYPTSQGFETILLPTNLHMEYLMDRWGVQREFHLGKGLHNGPYQAPYYREVMESHYGVLRHADGGGAPRPAPTVFDYRTISKDFSIWGWHFAVQRNPVEFVNLTNVTCDAFTIRGTGVVTVTAPSTCGTGVHGSSTFTVDLGPSQATDEPAGVGDSHAYGREVTVHLQPVA